MLVLTRFSEEVGGMHRIGKSPIPMSKQLTPNIDDHKPGRFAASCRKHVCGTLYLARGSRDDLKFAVGWLGRYLDSWTRLQDRVLCKLMAFIHFSVDYALVIVADPAEIDDFWCATSADSDHAGCPITRRSTSAGVLEVIGPRNTHATLDTMSHVQRSAAPSSGHAEVCALDTTLRKITLPACIPIDAAFGRRVQQVLGVDASVVISNVEKGEASKDLRYMAKYPGVSIGFVSDLLHVKLDNNTEPQFALEKLNTLDNVADIGTKPLELIAFHKHRFRLGILSKEEIADVARKLYSS
jgi:hypothetical protein